MRPVVWICVALFATAMSAVSFGAHKIVSNFGFAAGLLTIAVMLGAALYSERRRG